MKRLLYHEDKQRGTPDFPLEYHDLNAQHPRYQMPYHWHDEYEILYIKTGFFELILDDEMMVLRAGDAAVISGGTLHGGIPYNCTYECVVFDLRLLMKVNEQSKQQIAEILHRKLVPQNCFLSNCSIVQQSIQPMFEALRNRTIGWELMTIGCLFRFFGECFKQNYLHPAPRPLQDDKRILQLKTVFELIENDYAQPLTLNQLSEAVHMTPKYFCRFFKSAVHRTPIDYLNYYRIEQACYELASAEKNITEIALDVGFSNCGYFIRMFRKYKGITPGQYLMAMKNK